jgi:hypothetical protein
MAEQPASSEVRTTTEVCASGPEEIDIDLGVEVGFIIATTCTSLELDEDDELFDDELFDDHPADETLEAAREDELAAAAD